MNQMAEKVFRSYAEYRQHFFPGSPLDRMLKDIEEIIGMTNEFPTLNYRQSNCSASHAPNKTTDFSE